MKRFLSFLGNKHKYIWTFIVLLMMVFNQSLYSQILNEIKYSDELVWNQIYIDSTKIRYSAPVPLNQMGKYSYGQEFICNRKKGSVWIGLTIHDANHYKHYCDSLKLNCFFKNKLIGTYHPERDSSIFIYYSEPKYSIDSLNNQYAECYYLEKIKGKQISIDVSRVYFAYNKFYQFSISSTMKKNELFDFFIKKYFNSIRIRPENGW